MRLILSLFLVTFQLFFGDSSKLNVPRVLLPFSQEGSGFLLKGDVGCFEWTVGRPDILLLKPSESDRRGCSSSALIFPNPSVKSWTRTHVAVTATEVDSGTIMRADVILDRIKSIKIVTKTHELYLEDAPEEFAVRAYDEEGNEFSTLDTMLFEWKLENKKPEESDNTNIIRFIKFRDASYTVSKELADLEARGRQGHLVLLEGVKTGSVTVTVKPYSSRYKDSVTPASTWLVVIRNVFLVPHSATIMIGGIVDYQVELIRGSKTEILPLDHPDFSLSLSDTTIARLSSKGNSISGVSKGTVNVALIDHSTESSKSPISNIEVAEPDYIVISLLEGVGSWIVAGNDYPFGVEIFTEDHRNFYLSDNLALTVDSEDSKIFEIINFTKNGAKGIGRPGVSGTVLLVATLSGIYDESGTLLPLKKPLISKLQLEIFKEIKLLPEVSVFPWIPGLSHTVQKKIPDYDVSSFVWSSSNMSVSAVTQGGLASTQGLSGRSTITAEMKKADYNFGTALVHVLPIVRLEISDSSRQAQVGEDILLPIALYGFDENGSEIAFTDCSTVKFVSKIIQGSSFKVVSFVPSHENPKACGAVSLKAESVGTSVIRVSFDNVNDLASVMSYKPLIYTDPSNGEKSLMVGSSSCLSWTGGPGTLTPKYRKYSLTSETSRIFETSEIFPISQGEFKYSVKCLSEGEGNLNLAVILPRTLEFDSLSVSSTVKVVCGYPSSIKLTLKEPSRSEACPMEPGKEIILYDSKVTLIISVHDESGKELYGIPSSEFDVELSDDTLASLNDSPKIHTGICSHESESVQKFLLGKGRTGTLIIKASFRKKSLFLSDILSASITLVLVKPASTEPATLSLFRHPANIRNIDILGGSGYFKASYPSGILSVSQSSANNFRIVPKQSGDTIIKFEDLCLSDLKTSSLLTVTDLAKIEYILPEKVMLGDSVLSTVKLYNDKGELISDGSDKIRLEASKGSTAVNLGEFDGASLNVSGYSLGKTDITVRAHGPDSQSLSDSKSIFVFPPLSVTPKIISLFVGAEFQLETAGGPGTPYTEISFSVKNKEIASVSPFGLVKASNVGQTTIKVKAFERSSITGKEYSFGSDSVTVRVEKLSKVKIHAPIRSLLTKRTIPLNVLFQGASSQTVGLFGVANIDPPLEFHWSLNHGSDPVGSLHRIDDVYTGRQVLKGQHLGAIRFTSERPGRLRIKLKIKLSKTSSYLSDEIEIRVIDELKVVSPKSHCSSNLLMSPESVLKVETNSNKVQCELNSCHPKGLLKVSQDCTLSSSSGNGVCFLNLKSSDDQILGYTVSVSPIEYSMISLNLPSSKPVFLRGSDVPLKVSLHDKYGSQFDSVTAIEPLCRVSKFDVGAPTPSSLKLLKEEPLVLQCSVSSISDTVTLDVQSGLINRPEYGIGDALSLDLPPGPVGSLISDPPGHVSLSGSVLTFIKPGKCSLTYGNNVSRISSEILITPLEYIAFSQSGSSYVSSSNFVRFISFEHQYFKDLKDGHTPASNPDFYICFGEWDDKKLLTGTPTFIDGNYACSFSWISNPPLTVEDIRVKLGVADTVGAYKDSLSLTYFPEFRVSDETPSAACGGAEELLIIGTPSVLQSLVVESSDPEHLVIHPIDKNSGRWKLTLPEKIPSKILTVKISSDLTGQSIVLPVSLRLTEGDSTDIGWESAFMAFRWAFPGLIVVLISTWLANKIISRQNVELKIGGDPKLMHPKEEPKKKNTSDYCSPLNSENKPFLWTVDSSPAYISPERRSPRNLSFNRSLYS